VFNQNKNANIIACRNAVRPREIGGPGLSLFSLMVNPRLALGIPRLSFRFVADTNRWIVNGTVRQMLKVLGQLVSDNVLAQPNLLF